MAIDARARTATTIQRLVAPARPGTPLYRVLDRLQRIVLRSRLTDPGTRFVRLNGQLRLVREVPDIDDVAARQRNLDTVLEAAAQHGIETFAIQWDPTARIRLGAFTSSLAPLVTTLGRARPSAYLEFRDRDGRARTELVSRVLPEDVEDVTTFTYFEYLRPEANVMPFATRHGCRVDRWREEEGTLRTEVTNPITTTVPATMARPRIVVADRELLTYEPFTDVTVDQVTFPVDVVYMWVDGADPSWRARRDEALIARGQQPQLSVAASRFRDHGELRYSFRSLERFAPWVRHVYLVTDQQRPDWLVAEHPRLTVVDHRDIFTDPSVLPTFNSHAIGSQLHHIEGLSEHYLVMNDDVLFGRPVVPQLFFDANGVAKFFLSRATLPAGPPTVDDLPHEAARKHARALVTSRYGHTPTQAFKHTAIAQVRSLNHELEERYAEAFARTASHQFRSVDDLETVSWLHNYAGFFERRTRPGAIRYDYFNIVERAALDRLEHRLAGQSVDCLCVNDADEGDVDEEERVSRLLAFFEHLLPEPSSFERPAT